MEKDKKKIYQDEHPTTVCKMMHLPPPSPARRENPQDSGAGTSLSLEVQNQVFDWSG